MSVSSKVREIKFRAWNGECMVSPDYIDRDGVAWWKENSIPTCCKEPEQFTGLLDKNGKEIYENDCRRGKWSCCANCDNPQEYEATQVMQWNERDACFEWVGPYIPDFIEVEVIGNIYENPELVTA